MLLVSSLLNHLQTLRNNKPSMNSIMFNKTLLTNQFSIKNQKPKPKNQLHHLLHQPMCGSKASTDTIEPKSPKTRTPRTPRSSKLSSRKDPPSSSSSSSSATGTSYKDSSISSIKASLPENPNIYDFSEVCSATGNFQRNRFSSSSSWKCSLHNRDVVIFQRKPHRPVDLSGLQTRLSIICRSHHSSIIKLLGASLSKNYIYLVYDFVPGANLANCLRNPKNPNYTVLSTWLSRMQIATDLAHGLDYIHHSLGLKSNFIHNHIKSSSIIVTEDAMSARICHFGTSELCGENPDENSDKPDGNRSGKRVNRSSSRTMKIEGTRGYLAPELQSTGISSQKSDVYAFGVVILELLCGEEALKYRLEKGNNGGSRRVRVIETAREAVKGKGVRKWIDRRLKDSFPVEAAEKMVETGLECVEEDPNKRPEMGRVAVLISRLYLESKSWAESFGLPIDFTVSFAPR